MIPRSRGNQDVPNDGTSFHEGRKGGKRTYSDQRISELHWEICRLSMMVLGALGNLGNGSDSQILSNIENLGYCG